MVGSFLAAFLLGIYGGESCCLLFFLSRVRIRSGFTLRPQPKRYNANGARLSFSFFFAFFLLPCTARKKKKKKSFIFTKLYTLAISFKTSNSDQYLEAWTCRPSRWWRRREVVLHASSCPCTSRWSSPCRWADVCRGSPLRRKVQSMSVL